MSTDGELMMPVGTAEAWHQAQVLALRQISENLAAQTKRIEGLTDKVDDVRERLTRLEAQETMKVVEEVRSELKTALARVDQLEAHKDRAVGVAAFFSWLAKSAPWFFAGLAAFLAGIGLKDFRT